MTTFHAIEQGSWSTATWRLGAFRTGRPDVDASDILEGRLPRVDPDAGHVGFDNDEGPEPQPGYTFAVHAPRAERVLLEFYAAEIGEDACAEFEMAQGEDGVWRARIEGVDRGTLYGFRVWGPNWTYDSSWERGGSGAGFVDDVSEDGDRFNPNKVLFDPYAREVTHNLADPRIPEAGVPADVFATGAEEVDGRPRRELDSGKWAPKGIIVDDERTTGPRPFLPVEDSIIYEAHVQGLTAHPSSSQLRDLLGHMRGFSDLTDVPEELRGTYAGAGYMAPYLKALGITTVEFLPVQESTSTNTMQGPDTPRENYWGYTTLAYFAPNRGYAHDKSPGGPTREFKEMVERFHESGIEIYIDVVYNHSGEGGHWAGEADSVSFTSLGGFSTSEYYVLNSANMLIDGATGVSNQMNFGSDITGQLTLDSLTYWLHDMGVDGFRFDLAPVLGRKPDTENPEDWDRQKQFFGDHPVLVDIAKLADLSHSEVVAEAWDLWGYEVGNFPVGWAEWNGRYRDSLRDFTKGEANTGELMDQLNGDYDNFSDETGYVRTINFVTAHDGFTMMDLVSYNGKTNDELEWPFGPADGGSDDNKSWDSGGDAALRRTRLRNFLVLLMFSRGVPMIVAGDEYGRGQNGNNNPWNLNTVGIWNNYAQAATNAPMRLPVDPRDPENSGAYYDVFGQADAPFAINPVFLFFRALAWVRHASPSLRQRSWGPVDSNRETVKYLFRDPAGTGWAQDGDRALQMRVDAGEGDGGDFGLLINMTPEPVRFTLIRRDEDAEWERLIDTAPWAERSNNVFGSLAALAGGEQTPEEVRAAADAAEEAGLPADQLLDDAESQILTRIERDLLDADEYDVQPWSVAVVRQVR